MALGYWKHESELRTLKKRQKVTIDLLCKMVELSKKGMAYWHIAEKLNTSQRLVANYLRTIDRNSKGLPPLKGDHCDKLLLDEYYRANNITKVEEEPMEKGTKMTAREVEQILKLKGIGRSDNEIAAELNRSQSTISDYVRALTQAMNGTFVHQSNSGVRLELIQPYMRKSDGKPTRTDQILNQAAVEKENRKEIKCDKDGLYIVDPDNAVLIANELMNKVPADVIARLMRVDLTTIMKVQNYVSILKEKDNDKGVEYRNKGFLQIETCEALEQRIGFFPKERTEEDIEADWRQTVLMNQELMCDFLDSIDTTLKKILAAMAGTAEKVS